jgi:hypothetical protein
LKKNEVTVSSKRSLVKADEIEDYVDSSMLYGSKN